MFVVYVAGDVKNDAVKTIQCFKRGGRVTGTHITNVRQFRMEVPVLF